MFFKSGSRCITLMNDIPSCITESGSTSWKIWIRILFWFEYKCDYIPNLYIVKLGPISILNIRVPGAQSLCAVWVHGRREGCRHIDHKETGPVHGIAYNTNKLSIKLRHLNFDEKIGGKIKNKDYGKKKTGEKALKFISKVGMWMTISLNSAASMLASKSTKYTPANMVNLWKLGKLSSQIPPQISFQFIRVLNSGLLESSWWHNILQCSIV